MQLIFVDDGKFTGHQCSLSRNKDVAPNNRSSGDGGGDQKHDHCEHFKVLTPCVGLALVLAAEPLGIAVLEFGVLRHLDMQIYV